MTTAALVVTTFYESAARYGFPASVLSDNGAIFIASFRGDRGALSTELARLGIVFKHSRAYHPADSTSVRKELGKLFRWFHISESLAGTVIQAAGETIEILGVNDGRKLTPLRRPKIDPLWRFRPFSSRRSSSSSPCSRFWSSGASLDLIAATRPHAILVIGPVATSGPTRGALG